MRLVRASLGTLAVLGMELITMDAPPTTAYLQTYTDERCRASCLFCAQSSCSLGDLRHIARGQYIPADLGEVTRRLCIAFQKGYFYRSCIQTAMYPGMWDDTLYLVRQIKNTCNIPISLSVFPLDDEKYLILREMGVDQLVIPLDAATPQLFHRIKGAGAGGPFSWECHMEALSLARSVFPEVGTHIIVGMGETDQDVIELVGKLHSTGIQTALFAYTRLQGTKALDADPDIGHYRRVQLASYLIRSGLVRPDKFEFRDRMITHFGLEQETLAHIIQQGEAFITTGCSHCNRPYATETHDLMFNYPRPPVRSEIAAIRQQLGMDHGI